MTHQIDLFSSKTQFENLNLFVTKDTYFATYDSTYKSHQVGKWVPIEITLILRKGKYY